MQRLAAAREKERCGRLAALSALQSARRPAPGLQPLALLPPLGRMPLVARPLAETFIDLLNFQSFSKVFQNLLVNIPHVFSYIVLTTPSFARRPAQMETDMSAAFEQERRARTRLEGILSGDAEARPPTHSHTHPHPPTPARAGPPSFRHRAEENHVRSSHAGACREGQRGAPVSLRQARVRPGAGHGRRAAGARTPTPAPRTRADT